MNIKKKICIFFVLFALSSINVFAADDDFPIILSEHNVNLIIE